MDFLMADILILAGIVILLILAGFIFLVNHFYKIGVARGPQAMEILAEKDEVFSSTEFNNEEDRVWWETRSFKKLTIVTRDKLALTGYFLPSQTGSLNTVILFHGYRCKAASMAGFARMFHDELACNVLVPDARGHGESQGAYIGMGWVERIDVSRWVREVEKQVGPYVRVVLCGVSMGGAAVMMAAGEDLPASVKCIIEDCGYDTVFNEFKYQIKRLFHLPGFPLLQGASLMCKIRAGYSFIEASSIKQLQKTRLPVLFIHGADDDFVPVWMVQSCYQACASPKKLWIVTGAGHGLSFRTAPAEYKDRVAAWMDRYVGNEGSANRSVESKPAGQSSTAWWGTDQTPSSMKPESRQRPRARPLKK
jgi:fermentation-respiration switch protein FrsA (DUF1100 family)